jgi:hypothetical protein
LSHHKEPYERGNVGTVVPQLWALALAVPSTMSQLTATTGHIKNATNTTTKKRTRVKLNKNESMTVKKYSSIMK